MYQWAPYPFLRYIVFFLFGIITARYINFYLHWWQVCIPVIFYLLLVYAIPKKYFHKIKALAGLLGLIIISMAGHLIYHGAKDIHRPLHLLTYQNHFQSYLAKITEPPQRRGKTYRTVVDVKAIFQADSSGSSYHMLPCQGRVIIYQEARSFEKLPSYGDQIIIKGHPEEIAPAPNPHMFDYKNHLEGKNIYFQQYVKEQNWEYYQRFNRTTFSSLAYQLRNTSQQILLKNIPGIKEASIALALTIGVKDYLDEETTNSYANTGAMHVLAVSGLHVGIIYLLFSFLLTPIAKLPKGRWLSAILSISFLWFYALLTGWSPSVLRATVMFTTIILADTSRRKSSIYNTLALSAFILLCIQPSLLFTVGFQLSYLAVTGIVYLQPKIYQWFNFSFWLPDKIWQVTSVSIAAQVATFPLSLYYFHQFPVYFWLSNLFVIPAAFTILILGLVTIVSGFSFPPLAHYSGILLENLIKLVNFLIDKVQQLPYELIENISLTLPQAFILYIWLLLLMMLFYYRRYQYFVYLSGCTFSFAILSLYYCCQQGKTCGITFYKVDKQRNVDFTVGRKNYHLGTENQQTTFNVQPNHLYAGLQTYFISDEKNSPKIALQKFDNLRLAVWHGKKVIFIEEPFSQNCVFTHKIKTDVLVISNNAIKNLEITLSLFDTDLIIFDSSNHPVRVKKLMSDAQKMNIDFYSVPHQSALTIPTSY